MTHDCACSRPITDTAVICIHCGYDIDAALEGVAAYLAADLDISRSRQARIGTRGGSPRTDTPLPYAEHAADARDQLHHTLTRWARLIYRATAGTSRSAPLHGPACERCRHTSCMTIRPTAPPPPTLVGVAVWLRPRVGWLRYHPDGTDAWQQITDTTDHARRIIDRPADKLYAGVCDCGTDLYGRIDASYVICRDPSHDTPQSWPVAERRRWLLESARDVLATSTDISRAITRYAQPVTPSAIRGYVHRRRLRPVWCTDPHNERRGGAALYRLGDVLDILTAQAIRKTSA